MLSFLFRYKLVKRDTVESKIAQGSKITYSAEEVDVIYKMALKNGAEPSFILWFNEFKKK